MSTRLPFGHSHRVSLTSSADFRQCPVIEQEDSTSQPGLQAVDFVAWALRRKFEGDAAWAAIIEKRVVVLEGL